MRRLILIAAITALVLAKPKPETYKETEDFQYSRSSSDDGTKSGFYGAQRGNMGGNYERAHNMDNLAQHQMSGLVRQVDGELGDGAKTRTGSVYTAANSRGIYGSGSYDLSNLQGRNFAEGVSAGNSQSHLSLSSQNSRYGGQSYGMESNTGFQRSHSQNSRYSGYQTADYADQRRVDNLQAVDTSQGLGYESNNQAGYNMKYHNQFGSHGRSEFDQSSANLHSSSGYDANVQPRYITTPVKVVMRPGGRVAIPIAVPTYAVSQNVLSEDHNAINSDAEVLNQQAGLTPTNKVKHYEASYSYRKQWEKHHALPGDVVTPVPTENPFPKNSELYEDAQLLQSSKNQLYNTNLQTLQSNNRHNDQRAYSTSAGSSRSRLQASSQQSQSGFESQHNQEGLHSHQSQAGVTSQQSLSELNSQQSHSGFNTQQSSASSGFHANAYGHNAQTEGVASDLTNIAEDVNSKPKSYHSSYSYHKSWERQGDPYVIKPVGGIHDSQASQRLTSASSNSAAYSSRQYGSHSRHAQHGYSADCDDEGHIRVARSYNTDQELQQYQNQWEDVGQQTQSKLENLEDLGQQQQNKWDNLQDLGQQTQNQWDNLQQVGQETQNQWGNFEQLGQETQNQWDNLQQLGQQTQDKWDNLEDLGQQTHRDLDQHQNEKLEDLSQQSQNEDQLKNFEQQANFENLEQFSQQTQKEDMFANFAQNNDKNVNLDALAQHSQKQDLLTNFEQQENSQSENLDTLAQHSQKPDLFNNFEQQDNSQIENLDAFAQHSQKQDLFTNFEQQDNNHNENLEDLAQQNQKDLFTNFEQQDNSHNENLDVIGQQSKSEDAVTNFEQETNSQNENLPNTNIWNQIASFEPQSNTVLNADFINQQLQLLNKQDKSNRNLFDQSQHDQWYDANKDKNIDSHDFMKNFQGTDNEQQSLFPIFLSNTEQNKLWSQNKEQEVSWNTYHNQNTMTYFNNQENQLENSFPSSLFSSSATGSHFQTLFDGIDKIGLEVTATEGNVGHKNLFPPDYSNFYSQNENANHTKNANWNNLPVNPATSSDSFNTDIKSEDKKIGHNNLFDEFTKITSTTVLPIFLSSHSPTPVENVHNINSQDEGRGDIGPEDTPFEITTDSKPFKTPEEIETLSLTKEAQIPKKKDGNLDDENSNTKLSVTTISQPPNITPKRQYKLFSTVQSQVPTTVPTIEINTSIRSISNSQSEQTIAQPNLDIITINNNLLPDLEKQMVYQQTVENIEVPEDVQQQQNLNQQSENFGQLPNSWIPTDNFEQGYDQLNMEQQFEVFKPYESMQNKNSQDLGLQVHSSTPSIRDEQNRGIEQGNPQKHQDTEIPSNLHNYERKYQPSTAFKDTIANTQQVMEPLPIRDVNSNDPNLQNNKKVEDLRTETIQAPAETSSEKPGFWKSVGNKFTNAKNKVYSWFKSS